MMIDFKEHTVKKRIFEESVTFPFQSFIKNKIQTEVIGGFIFNTPVYGCKKKGKNSHASD